MNLANVTHKSEDIICQIDKFGYLKKIFFLFFLSNITLLTLPKVKSKRNCQNLKKQNQKTIVRLKKICNLPDKLDKPDKLT